MEEVLVVHADFHIRSPAIHQTGVDVLIGFLDLLKLRRRCEIRHHDAIAAERGVVRVVVEISTIGEELIGRLLGGILGELQQHQRVGSRSQFRDRQGTPIDGGAPHRSVQPAARFLGINTNSQLVAVRFHRSCAWLGGSDVSINDKRQLLAIVDSRVGMELRGRGGRQLGLHRLPALLGVDEKLDIPTIADLERVGGIALRDDRLAAFGASCVEPHFRHQRERAGEVELRVQPNHRAAAEQALALVKRA